MLRIRIAAARGRDPIDPTGIRTPSNGTFCQRLEVGGGGTSNTLTSVAKDNLVYIEYD